MSQSIYEKLGIPFTGVLFERAAERAVVALLGDFQDTGEPLNGAPVWPGVRGIPMVFQTYNPQDQGTAGSEFEEAKDAASHIVVLGSGYQEKDGYERCQLKIVVVTMMRGGTADEQELLHERRCAAVRGIMGPAAMRGVVQRCNQLSDELEVRGWEAAGPAADEFVEHRWVHTLTLELVAATRGIWG